MLINSLLIGRQIYKLLKQKMLVQTQNSPNQSQQLQLRIKSSSNQLKVNYNQLGIQRQKSLKNTQSFILNAMSDKYVMTPELLQVKNTILLFLLALSGYGIYYVVGDFIDFIIIGYITGKAYSQTRSKFVTVVSKHKFDLNVNQKFSIRILKISLLMLLAFLLPRLRYMLIYPHQFKYLLDFNKYVESFWKFKNITVIICQILIALYSIFLLLLPKLKIIGDKIRPTKKGCIHFMFALIVIIVTFSFVIVIPTVFFKQVGEVGFLVQRKLEEKLQCQLINFGSHQNKTLPPCSERIAENSLIKQTIQEFRNQNQTVQSCKQYIQKFQLDYIGHNVFNYEQIACTWYSIAVKASNYTAEKNYDISTASIFSTGTNVFKNIFGNLTSILVGISNYLFYFTIWLSTFTFTINLSDNDLRINQLFSQKKKELVIGATKIITSTCMIVFWHFFASVFLLELFGYTQINLIISILLSFMAFIPYFRPWFGVLFVSIIRAIFLKTWSEYLISAIFVGFYRLISQFIYTFYYSKLQIHQIITTLSVLFGIYRFGISGIFYGPLIIIVYTFVEKQLLSNFKQNFTKTPTYNQEKLPQTGQSKKIVRKQKQQQQENQIEMLIKLSSEHKTSQSQTKKEQNQKEKYLFKSFK